MTKLVEILAWPAVAVIVGMAFLVMQRLPIADFIRRTRGLKGFGGAVEAAPSADAEAQAAATAEAPKADLNATPYVQDESFLPPMLKEVTEAILADPRVKAAPNDSARVQLLARHLAAAQAAVFFEATYRLLFNSQIVAIREANVTGGITLERARHLHGVGAERMPATYALLPFDGWLTFIGETSKLVIRNPDGRIHSTVRGQEFLRYLTTKNYDDKPYQP